MDNFLDRLKDFGVTETAEPEIQQEEQVVESTSDFTNFTTDEPQEQPQAQKEQVAEVVEKQAQEAPQEVTEIEKIDSSFKFGKQTEQPIQEEVGLSDDAVLNYLNEKLGIGATTLQELTKPKEVAPQLDAELEAVLNFKKETGKSLSDYYLYQQMNTSEMGDIDAIKFKFQLEYPDLSAEERDLLISDTYKLDEDAFSESELRTAKVRLKADAIKAKHEINKVRELYAAPAQKQQTEQAQDVSVFDEGWFRQMETTVDNLESLEFELGDGATIDFKIEPSYKQNLKQTNKGIENYFDQYFDEKNNFDHRLFNAHRAALENMESIVKTAYHQGLSNGQRKVVETASNVKSETPQVNKTNPDAQEQVMNFLKNFGKAGSGGLVLT